MDFAENVLSADSAQIGHAPAAATPRRTRRAGARWPGRSRVHGSAQRDRSQMSSPTRRQFLATSVARVTAAAAPAFDVAVYSGVPSGIAAAIAASRQSARLLLIEPTRRSMD